MLWTVYFSVYSSFTSILFQPLSYLFVWSRLGWSLLPLLSLLCRIIHLLRCFFHHDILLFLLFHWGRDKRAQHRFYDNHIWHVLAIDGIYSEGRHKKRLVSHICHCYLGYYSPAFSEGWIFNNRVHIRPECCWRLQITLKYKRNIIVLELLDDNRLPCYSSINMVPFVDLDRLLYELHEGEKWNWSSAQIQRVYPTWEWKFNYWIRHEEIPFDCQKIVQEMGHNFLKG